MQLTILRNTLKRSHKQSKRLRYVCFCQRTLVVFKKVYVLSKYTMFIVRLFTLIINFLNQ